MEKSSPSKAFMRTHESKSTVSNIVPAPPSSAPTDQSSSLSTTSTAIDADGDLQKQPRLSSATDPTTGTEKGSDNYARPSLPAKTLLAFTALCLSIFLVALDTVLLPTALPTISLSFHIADSLYAWTGGSYLLANAASIPFWGKLSDIFGRKPVLLTANIIFLGGSIVCAVSIDAAMLIAGRAIQGLGGGGVVVLVHVCVSDMFAIRDRSLFMGTVGGVWAVASALGPSIGGIFAQHLSWQWCFYINVPIVSISIITLYFTLNLPSSRISLVKGLASMDWLGAVTILAATSLLLIGLQTGSSTAYTSVSFIILVVLGALLYIVFPITQWWESKRDRNPIMPLRIFTDISNLSALSVCACDALVFNSVAYFLPLYFQVVLGKSPSISGVFMLAIAIPLAIVSFASGFVIEKTGRVLEVLQGGLLLMTLGVGLLVSLQTTTSLAQIFVFLIIIGLGFGPNFGAPLIALQTRIQPCDIATGTAAFGFIRMVSGAIGVVVGQVLFQGLMKAHHTSFVDIGLTVDLAQDLTGGAAISSANTITLLEEDQQLVVHRAMTTALRGTWTFYTVISALGLMVSFGIKRTKLERNHSDGSAVETAASPTGRRTA